MSGVIAPRTAGTSPLLKASYKSRIRPTFDGMAQFLLVPVDPHEDVRDGRKGITRLQGVATGAGASGCDSKPIRYRHHAGSGSSATPATAPAHACRHRRHP